MNVSNLFSYFQAGFRGAFQFAVFPLNMIRRFSYSLMATIANRLGQRTITGDTTKTVTTELLKENTHNVVIGIPNPVQPPLRTTVTKTSSDTVINIDLNDDDSKIPVPDVTDGPSKKRSSISEQGEKSETVEKKPRLACQFQFDQSKTSASAQVDTLSASTVPIENQTNVKGNKVERGIRNEGSNRKNGISKKQRLEGNDLNCRTVTNQKRVSKRKSRQTQTKLFCRNPG